MRCSRSCHPCHVRSGSSDGTIRVWNLRSAKCDRVIAAGKVCAFVCGATSSFCPEVAKVAIFAAHTNCSHRNPFQVVALSAAGGHRVVAATSDDFVVRQRNLTKRSRLASRRDTTSDGPRRPSAPHTKKLIISPQVKIWNVNNGEFVAGLTGHNDRVLALQLLPDGRIASGGVEGVVFLWRPSTGTRELALSTGGKVVGLAALPGGTLATAGLDSVKIWSTATGHCMQSIASGKVVCCAAQADGRLVTGHDAQWRVWNPLDGSCVRTSKGRRAATQAVLPLPDGRIVTAAPDGCIRVWAAQDPPVQGLSQAHSDRVSSITCLPDGRIVSASWDSTLRIWCGEDCLPYFQRTCTAPLQIS